MVKYWSFLSLTADWETPLKESPAQWWKFQRPDQISFEGSQQNDEAHLHDCRPTSHAQSEGDHGAPGDGGTADSPEYLGEDDVVGEEHRDQHRTDQQQVGPQRLRPLSHELFIIETEQQQGWEEGQKTTVEDLSHENDVSSIRWKIHFVE